jgi:hypothetical protein
MKGTDKFLIGIVGGVLILVVVAFAIAFLRPKPSYQPEDTPEGVTYNYLFAVRKADYARAYGYLSPTLKGYPASAEAFTNTVNDHKWSFRTDTSSALSVQSTRVSGAQVIVTVREAAFYPGGLFGSGESTSTFDVTLTRAAGSGVLGGVLGDQRRLLAPSGSAPFS